MKPTFRIGRLSTSRDALNVRFWLLADLLRGCDLGPLLIQSGHTQRVRIISGIDPKADIFGWCFRGPHLTQSGHWRMSGKKGYPASISCARTGSCHRRGRLELLSNVT